MPPINVHADLSSGARGLNFGQSLHIFICTLFMPAVKALVSLDHCAGLPEPPLLNHGLSTRFHMLALIKLLEQNIKPVQFSISILFCTTWCNCKSSINISCALRSLLLKHVISSFLKVMVKCIWISVAQLYSHIINTSIIFKVILNLYLDCRKISFDRKCSQWSFQHYIPALFIKDRSPYWHKLLTMSA